MPPLELSAPPPPSWEGGNKDGSGIPPPPTPSRRGEGDRSLRAAIGESSPAGTIWRDGAFHLDEWQVAPEEGNLPEAPIIVSRKRWLADRDGLASREGALALRIEPGDGLDDIAGDIGRFALIALSFPKFSDGRAFSTARLLREKYGFTGELRAVGNVLADQIPFMRRVGFDSYEVTHAPTRRALAEGRIAEVSLHYQPGERGEPRSSR